MAWFHLYAESEQTNKNKANTKTSTTQFHSHVETNEDRTNKQNRDRLIDGEQDDTWGRG